MRIPLFKRLTITALNIIFPPLAVALLTGFTSRDTLLNSLLFLLAIIPSHVHGFYISIVYFTRKRRVRRGQYPGTPRKVGVWSERVLTGGVGWSEAERMKYGSSSKEGGRVTVGDEVDVERARKRRSKRDSDGRRVSKRSSALAGGFENGVGGGETQLQPQMEQVGNDYDHARSSRRRSKRRSYY